MADIHIVRKRPEPSTVEHHCKLPAWSVPLLLRGFRRGAEVFCSVCGKQYRLEWGGGYDWGPQWQLVKDPAAALQEPRNG